jgi:hypothetical protein
MRHSIAMALGFVGVLLVAQPLAAAPTAAQKCAADKLRAAAKKAQGLLSCHASAISRGQVVDPACVLRAVGKFEAKFARIEARGGCVTVGDVGTIESHVDDFVAALVAALPATTSTTTSTTTTSCPTSTALYCGVSGCGGVGPPALCPTGQTCDPDSCSCVGPPVPCGDVRVPICRYGECPPGLTCRSDSSTCAACSCQ